MIPRPRLLLILAFFMAVSFCQLAMAATPGEIQALKNLANFWPTLGWTNLDNVCNGPDIPFINCGPNKNVVGLNITIPLTGSLETASHDIANLPFLATLALSPRPMPIGQLSGTVPQNLFHIPTIDLSGNQLSGTVPTTTSSQNIDLSLNYLTGSVPDSLVSATSLVSFKVSGNKFNAPLPTDYAATLRVLDLSYNYFTGTIPQQIATLVGSASSVDLRANALTGTIPFQIFNQTHVADLFLEDNQLLLCDSDIQFPGDMSRVMQCEIGDQFVENGPCSCYQRFPHACSSSFPTKCSNCLPQPSDHTMDPGFKCTTSGAWVWPSAMDLTSSRFFPSTVHRYPTVIVGPMTAGPNAVIHLRGRYSAFLSNSKVAIDGALIELTPNLGEIDPWKPSQLHIPLIFGSQISLNNPRFKLNASPCFNVQSTKFFQDPVSFGVLISTNPNCENPPPSKKWWIPVVIVVVVAVLIFLAAGGYIAYKKFYRPPAEGYEVINN